jgi:hypothetical protein
MHRLEVHRAGMIEAPLAGSRSLEERSELLKAFRARWERLHWTQATHLPSTVMGCPQLAGTTLVYAGIQGPPIIYYNQLPLGGTLGSSWEDRQWGLNRRGMIKVFSAHFGTNLLAVLMEEWVENAQ